MYLKRGNMTLRDNSILVLVVSLVVFSSLFFFSGGDITGYTVACVDSDGDGYVNCTQAEYACSTETYLTTGGNQRTPDIFGDYVFYEDSSFGNGDIVVYDLNTGVVLSGLQMVNSEIDRSVSAYGDNFVWTCVNSGPQICSENVNTKSLNFLTSTASQKAFPDIYGNIAVWQDDVSGDFDILGANVFNGNSFTVADGALNQMKPRLYGSKLVYEQDGKIFYDDDIQSPSDGQQVSSGLAIARSPDIYGDYIVWQGNNGGNWDIVLYDATGPSVTVLTSDPSPQMSPRVYNDFVVWHDFRNGNWDIYGYNITSAEEIQITNDSSNQLMPAIYGGKIVWQDDRNANLDVYYLELGAECALLAGDCNDTDATVNPGVSEICGDSIDNDCDASVDEACTTCTEDSDCTGDQICLDYVCVDGVDCLTEVYWANSSEEISSAEFGDVVYAYALDEDAACNDATVVYDFYSYDGADYTWLEDYTTMTVYFEDYGVDYAMDSFTVPTTSESIYYLFKASTGLNTLVSSNLLACENFSDCEVIETVDTAYNTSTTTTSVVSPGCMYEGVDYNGWLNETSIDYINSAVVGDLLYLVSIGDGTCVAPGTFYIYSVVESNSVYATGSLVETLSATVEYQEDDAMDYVYADWTATGTDTYYYYIAQVGDGVVAGDTIKVCTSACTASSVTVSDIDTYLALYANSYEGGNLDSGVGTDELSCEDQWDCTGVQWSDCIDGIMTRDISQCIIPDSAECQEEQYWPDYEITCVGDEEVDVVRDTADVPVFGWLNVLIVVGVLVGFYYRKVKKV